MHAAASKSMETSGTPSRPQRASALAATKRVTEYAAKQMKDLEVCSWLDRQARHAASSHDMFAQAAELWSSHV